MTLSTSFGNRSSQVEDRMRGSAFPRERNRVSAKLRGAQVQGQRSSQAIQVLRGTVPFSPSVRPQRSSKQCEKVLLGAPHRLSAPAGVVAAKRLSECVSGDDSRSSGETIPTGNDRIPCQNTTRAADARQSGVSAGGM